MLQIFLSLTNVWHSLGSTPTFVDMRSTAHPPALLCGVSPLEWQKSFVAFQLNNFFFLREFCLKQFVLQEMKPNNRRDQDVCIRTTLILSDFVRSRLVYFNGLLGLGFYGKTELLICCTGSYAKLLNSLP